MGVHFWPAFNVISRTTSFTRRSNRSVPGVQSGPRMAAFMLSASMFTRTERRRTFAWERIRAAVSAEPVKETMSSSRTWASRSRAEPQMMEIAPGGKISAFTISSTIRCVSQAVGEAGFTSVGHPDGDAREQRGRSLFAETPGGKIKCIDENCGALCGHQKMLPNKRVALRERNQGAFL